MKRTTAPHIRGRIYVQPRHRKCDFPIYYMEVVNLSTGKVIATDNCRDLGRLVDTCREATIIARGTWFWSYRKKDVQP